MKRNMVDKNTIIDEHLREKKLIGVWELVRDSSQMAVEGYALSLEGYFLEIETMLDVSAIAIGAAIPGVTFPWRLEQAVSTRRYLMIDPSPSSLARGCQNGACWLGKGAIGMD